MDTTTLSQTKPSINKPLLLGSLITANLVTIGFFIFQSGSIMQALWCYWIQSAIIGLVNFARIMKTPLSGTIVLGSTIPPILLPVKLSSNGRNIFAACMFIVFYGFEHLFFMLILFGFSQNNIPLIINGYATVFSLNSRGINVGAVLICGLIFGIHHIISFRTERKYLQNEARAISDLKALFLDPFARILPMHLILILAPFVTILLGTSAVFVVFMVIKTVVDIYLSNKHIEFGTNV